MAFSVSKRHRLSLYVLLCSAKVQDESLKRFDALQTLYMAEVQDKCVCLLWYLICKLEGISLRQEQSNPDLKPWFLAIIQT